MKLSEYNKKRDFKKTAEPAGKVKKGGKELRFVVQKHAASHLHFDYRLEIDGVLVSWAVPKGPSADTTVKRLAMHVEDHPMDYIDFEGTIPKGQYGGGTVMVWDTGTFMAEGSDSVAESEKVLKTMLEDGNIKVVMNGSKLKGVYHIVQMKGKDKEWLLLKGKDDYADKKEFDQKSVLSGRTMEQIASDKDPEIWNSNKDDKSKSKRAVKKADPENKIPDSKITPSFTAEDVADARKLDKFPSEWQPQLATLTDAIFDNEDWLFETKYDGYRTLIQVNKGTVQMVSRNAISFNSRYAPLVKAFENITEDVVIDGEIVVEDDKHKSHFQWLQDFQENPGRGHLKCYVFDIIYFNGYDLTSLGLLQRKKILEALLPESDEIIYSSHTIGKGAEALKEIEKNGGEGLICKKVNSHYMVNKRSRDWLKVKVVKEQEMVIGGFTDPQGSRTGFGSLLLGFYQEGKFVYSGKVGTGFNEASLKELHSKLKKLEVKMPPFETKPKEPRVHWVKPQLVAQIKFSEWTETGSLRHPVFIALRDDKDPKTVARETAGALTPKKGRKKTEKVVEDSTAEPVEKKPAAKQKATDKTDKETAKNAPAVNKPKTKKGKPAKADTEYDKKKIEVTNPDKIFWPKEGYTKGDVIDYYDKMATYLLPYIQNRPQSLKRTPDGIKSDGFFQKNVAGMVPAWIKTKRIKSKSTSETIEYLICNDKDTLIYLANWGCIEINPWSSRVGTINNPDFIIFDLDPNDAPDGALVTTAKKVKEILDSLGINGYLKTSGGKGLHIFIPILPKYSYDQSRDFSHIISQFVLKALPEITSLERMPNKRKGKVYLDFLQNGKGKTMSCAYSLRPREGATASTPLEWEELDDKNFSVKNYDIRTLPERVKVKGDLWANFFDDAIDLKEILAKLE